MGRIDIFGIAEVKPSFLVIHDAVGILPIVVHLVEISLFARDVIELGHDRHHHEQTVHPPEIVVGIGRYLIAHDFQGTFNLLRVVLRVKVIEVGIYLEAYLIVAEEHPVAPFAVGLILPCFGIRAGGSPPVAALGPCCAVVAVLLIASHIIGGHVANVIDGSVPEVVAMVGMALLPCLVDGV